MLDKLESFKRIESDFSIPKINCQTSYKPEGKNILYCLHQSLPHATNGYATRSHGISTGLIESGFKVLAVTRLGFPWDDKVLSPRDDQLTNYIDKVLYKIKNGILLKESPLDEYIHECAKYLESEALNFRADIMISSSNHITALPALIASRRLNLPFVYEVRGLWEVTQASINPKMLNSERYNFTRKLEKIVALEADLVVTITDELSDELVNWGVSSDRIKVVPNAVNSTLFKSKTLNPKIAESLKLSPGVPVIGYAGSFMAYEGLELLLEAMEILKGNGQKFIFVLVGDGKNIENLRKRAKELGIENDCRFIGRVPFHQVSKYIDHFDIVPIPRLSTLVTEMVSALKPLEAMAMGKALILSDVKPNVHLAGQNNERALLFRSGSAEDLYQALQFLIERPAERKRLGKAARAWVERERTWKKVSNDYGAYIIQLMKNYTSSNLELDKSDEKKPKSLGENQFAELSCLSLLDEISEECWRYEFKQYPIRRFQCLEQLKSSQANFCFIESCWNGNKGAWQYAFTSPRLKHQNSQALLELLSNVKEKMPLVFWNKEDPMHYKKFLPIAKFADIIFTTDSEKLLNYQKDIPEAKIYVAPFAAQPKICNPSGRFNLTPESVCFAGSYYSKGHDERKRQMKELLPSIVEFKGTIYDRFSKLSDERYKYPEIYHEHIRDSVPFSEITTIYKHFKVFLNVNTIVDSPTMMSRRVYELLASGTPVVSSPSRAIQEQFSGIVQVANNAQEANKIIKRLLTDDYYWERISHLGYREVMKKHTYAHRYQDIRNSLGYESSCDEPLVSVVTCTNRPHMSDRIVENISRQIYNNIELILIVQGFLSQEVDTLRSSLHTKAKNIKKIKIIIDNTHSTLGERFNNAADIANGEYLAKMDDDDYYFENYLSDMLIPFSFGDYAMVGKRELFMYLSESKKLIRRNNGQKHQESQFVAGPTFVIKKSIFDIFRFEQRNTGEDSSFLRRLIANNYRVYAADPFNFIQFRGLYNQKHTWKVDDDYFLSGPSKIEAEKLDTSKVRF